MSFDLLEFEKNLTEIEEELKSQCEDSYIIESNFVAIRDMIEILILKRDKRIKELESKLKSSPKKEATPVKQNEPVKDKPKKECPPGKIVNPKTGRCINKPKPKTNKTRGRPKKTVSKDTVKPKKECPPHKIINPKTGRCINKPKPKTNKTRGRPKKTPPEQNYNWIGQSSSESYEPSPRPPKKELSFDEALEHIRKNGKPGSYRTFLNDIKNKFGITLKYDNHGDEYAVPDLYFMKGKKECSREEMLKVQEYVIDAAKKLKKEVTPVKQNEIVKDKPKEKTQKTRGRPKKTSPRPPKKELTFDEVLKQFEYYR